MRSRGASLALVFGTIVAACGGPDTSSPPVTPDQVEVVADLRYTCGGREFDLALVSAPGVAEQGLDNLAAALRAAVLPGGLPDPIPMPASGWHLLGSDGRTAEFANFTVHPPVDIAFESVGGAWQLAGFGQCRPTLVLGAGLGVATWVLDPEDPGPGPMTTNFTALVTERACASGQSSEGRIVGPRIVRLDDRVLVVFAVRRPPGNAQTCQGNPWTRVRVDIGEPLGDRELVDPSILFPSE